MDKSLTAIVAHIKANEGEALHPYLDSKGLITTGTGFNVDTSAAFKAQPWQVTNGDGSMRPATRAEIDDGLGKMTGAKKTMIGKKAEDFEDTTALRLPKEVNDQMVEDKARTHSDAARKAVGDEVWNRLTEGQRAVLTDVDYADPKGIRSYKNLIDAAKRGDAKDMADQSRFIAGKAEDGTPLYNWDRVARNRAAAQGVSFEEAQRQVAEEFKDRPDLPDVYKAILKSKDKRSDAGDGDTPQQVAETPVAADPPATQAAFVATPARDYGPDIVRTARDVLGSGRWRTNAVNSPIGAGMRKDHQFVVHTLEKTGCFGGGKSKLPTPEQWADPEFDIPGWPTVTGPAKAGDVLATPKGDSSKGWYFRPGQQMGIATGEGSTIGVHDNEKVAEGSWGMLGWGGDRPTIRRYSVTAGDDGGNSPEGSLFG